MKLVSCTYRTQCKYVERPVNEREAKQTWYFMQIHINKHETAKTRRRTSRPNRSSHKGGIKHNTRQAILILQHLHPSSL